MKKITFALLLAVLVSAGAFAEFSMSIGGGLLGDLSFGKGYKYSYQGEDVRYSINNYGIGGFFFFDVTYAEIDIYFAYGILNHVVKSGNDKDKEGGSSLQLGFELLGKYPIDLGKVVLFPLLGFQYNMALTSKEEDGDDFLEGDSTLKYLSQFGFLAGLGFDLPFNSNVFLRMEALLNIRLPSKIMKEAVKSANEGTDITATIGIGPRIKIAVGYKF